MGEEGYPANWGFAQIASWITISIFGQPIIYAAMALGLPTVLLYCSQCWTIYRHRQFHNGFYLLFVTRAFQDMFLLLGSYINYRLPGIAGTLLLPLYEKLPNWLFVVMWASNPYGIAGSSFATTFMLLNRLSSILFPFSHDKIWQKSLPFVLVICLVVPLYYFRDLFGMQCFIQQYENGKFGIGANTTMVIFADYDLLLNFASSLFFLFLCLLINVAIFVVYKRRQQQTFGNANRGVMQQNGEAGAMTESTNAGTTVRAAGAAGDSQQQRERQKTERKLIVYAVCTFASHMLHSLLMIGFFFAYQQNEMLVVGGVLTLTPLVYDTGSILIPAWLLLWASSDFRQQWSRQFWPAKWPLLGRKYTTTATTRVSTIAGKQQQQNSGNTALWAQRRRAND